MRRGFFVVLETISSCSNFMKMVPIRCMCWMFGVRCTRILSDPGLKGSDSIWLSMTHC